MWSPGWDQGEQVENIVPRKLAHICQHQVGRGRERQRVAMAVDSG